MAISIHLAEDQKRLLRHKSLEYSKNAIGRKDISNDADIVVVQKEKSYQGLQKCSYEDSASWLGGCLPDLAPRARVFTFGYPSKTRVRWSKSTLEEDDFARGLLNGLHIERISATDERRRIIFIGDSAGGPICEKALLMARGSEHYDDLYTKTCAVLSSDTTR